ncbi:sensor domain-containing diguanylate cyclase [Hephaestia mangrovi]|uniref:sensor domain-containing diguanylate cyclase n=1 Tax=Hephaestia mangrovi TaxID=2873268 RepID=UPI001CA725BA|nr:GGDEF domain-containing protein [Hephaestia mangrovi]MBY8829330.1 GGDEF domain-containing protein [Hephaestia mangrovi]
MMIGAWWPMAAAAAPLRVNALCHAVTATPGRFDAPPPARFSCRGAPAGYQRGTLWLHVESRQLASNDRDAVLLVRQSRFSRLAVGFAYADGHVSWQQVTSGGFGDHWRPGGQIAFEAPVRDAALVGMTLRFDRLASHDLLQMRIVGRGAAVNQSAMLAALIGVALTLLLIGAIYNASLAVMIRHRFLAWHGAWAACMLLWGVIWSQLELPLAPGIAGTVAAQTCTFLACLAIALATISAATFLGRTALPRQMSRMLVGIGVSVGVVGIPTSLVRGHAIEGLATLLGILVLADLAAVALSLAWAWRRGSVQARDLVWAWSVPMLALAVTQVTDVGTILWGGGAQILVLFAGAWQTVWLSYAATRSLARLRIERDEAREAEAIAVEHAERDPLTGLCNRRGFEARVARLIAVAAREQAPVALLLIDVDRFKSVNDAHGHRAGDAVLRALAARLRRWESRTAAVARLGGEEFALLITGIGGFALSRFADGVRCEIAACDHRAIIGNRRVTASIGVAEMGPGDDFETLYEAADIALYTAKHGGRNRVIHHRDGPAPRITGDPALGRGAG